MKRKALKRHAARGRARNEFFELRLSLAVVFKNTLMRTSCGAAQDVVITNDDMNNLPLCEGTYSPPPLISF